MCDGGAEGLVDGMLDMWMRHVRAAIEFPVVFLVTFKFVGCLKEGKEWVERYLEVVVVEVDWGQNDRKEPPSVNNF